MERGDERYGGSRYNRETERRPYGADDMPRGRDDYGPGRTNFGSSRSEYGRRAYGGNFDERGPEGGRRGEVRPIINRAGDEVRSWFDDEAEHRRRMDGREGRSSSRDTRNDAGAGQPAETWADVRARDVMTRDVACVLADDPAERAARLMLDCDCGAIPVVGRGGRIRGMVTDRDIAVRLVARGVDTRRARVGDCMTHEVFACHEFDAAEDCLREMSRHQVRRVPVVDDRGRVVGIVSQGDLARHAAQHTHAGERRAVADALGAVSEPSQRSYR